jgi:glycosyltransferase involved in cell wall biosynthesis
MLPTRGSVVDAPHRPSAHPRSDWFEHVTLPRLCHQGGYDIYHGTFNVLPWIRPAPVTIVTVHDVAVFAMPEAYSWKFARLARVLLRRALALADRVIVVSEATGREVVRHFPWAAAKLVTILNGVSAEFVDAGESSPSEAAMVARRVGIVDPYVLFVGNLEPKKNLARLIAAFERAKRAHGLSEKLVIVGERPAKLPDIGVERGAGLDAAVRFTGYVADADLPMLYRGARLVAYPSIYEGFGMPVLEGMAAGVPVLTSSASSLPEVAGGAAMLVDPFDVDAIGRGLVEALRNDAWRARAVTAGRNRAAELSWDVNAEKTAELYRRLCDDLPRNER